MNKVRNFLKKTVLWITCTVTVGTAIITSIPTAYAASYGSSGILGTSTALGSPILNSNFTIDNWNKWEMICWGVFLSNFCQPLVDDYQSAFKTGAGGSDGAGYKALCFGSGSDYANKDVVEAFCDYAIAQQQNATKKQVYVSYRTINIDPKTNEIEYESESDADPNVSDSVIRPAHFDDFFVSITSKSNTVTSIDNSTMYTAVQDDLSNTTTVFDRNTYSFNDNYSGVLHLGKYSLPIFWIQGTSGKYVKIFDYNNTVDMQMFNAMINAVRDESAFQTALGTFLEDPYDYNTSSTSITMDVFGNILVNNKMLVPAACNQHLTTDNKINLLNSYTFNSYASTYSTDTLIKSLAQNDYTGITATVTGVAATSGFPAFSASKINAVGLLYYDLDATMVGAHLDGNIGKGVEDMFKLDISSRTNRYPLKFELTSTGNQQLQSLWDKWTNKKSVGSIDSTAFTLSNMPTDYLPSKQPEMLSYIINTDGTQVSLFNQKPVLIMPQMDGSNKEELALKYFFNYLYQCYTGKAGATTEGDIPSSVIEDIFRASTLTAFKDKCSSLWSYFQAAYPQYKSMDFPSKHLTKEKTRMVLVYPVSDVLKAVSQVLGCVDGTEFSTYSTMIYMTYLDWYGVVNKTTLYSGTEATSNFDTDIFDPKADVSNADPGEIAGTKSPDDLEDEVLQMSYLILEPEAGRSYRKSLMYNGLTDFIYEQYNRIVFGGSSDNYTGSASKSNSGFLAVETYSENWLTSWFLDSYTIIAVWAIAICIVIMVILGLLKGRKLSWYVFSMFVIVTVILIVPSSGEIVPYATSRAVQKLFVDNMTNWSISEGVSNATLEADSATSSGNFAGFTDEESQQAVKLIKQLNVVYLDRSLMLKQDISQKLTQKLGGVYTEIQQLQSTRWILPMVMQQFTNENDVEGSVYVKLSNVWDDGSNLYWYFKPSEAGTVTKDTTTSQQFLGAINGGGLGSSSSASVAIDTIDGYEKVKDKEYFEDFVEPEWADDTTTDINYANYSYTINTDPKYNVHLFSYILPDKNRQVFSRKSSLGVNGENYKDANSWQLYIDHVVSGGLANKANWDTGRDGNSPDTNYNNSGFELIADQYDRTNATTLKAGYSFYKTTESPYYYFFNVIKDSFNESSSVGHVIGRLQGGIKKDADGNEVRANFMYATKSDYMEQYDTLTGTGANITEYTGYIRDVLDLQNFFTNVVPYMYQITLETGGFDGESGILGDSVISDESDLYGGQLQSWAYRCNWAVKLMENPEYSKPSKIGTGNGTRVTITNPLLPECYESAGRKMVFSEAQMEAYGLKEADLSLVEMLCLKTNKEVCKQWTLLVNYAGTEGLTKEVLYRQMATDATTIFNSNFSTGGLLNNQYGLYPTSIDLRYLSFDSIMKMLMLNVSKDTSYIYGDTMSTLIESTDLGTSLLLLVVAACCAFVIPMIRTILMALIFYLGFISILKALFSSTKYKARISCGQLISNLLFMLYTLIYYAVFSGLMAVTASDQVLSVNKISTSAGNPVWVLLAVLAVSVIYVAVMWWQICFCFRNFRDMGMEVYSQVIRQAVSRIGDAFGSARDGITQFFSSEDTTYNNSYRSSSSKSLTSNNSESTTVNQATDKSVKITNDDNDSDKNKTNNYSDTSVYAMDDTSVDIGETTTADINAEIEAGKVMDNN